MKLLYIWIEDFRNIFHQGIVVDDEYLITVKDADTTNYSYYSSDGTKQIVTGSPPRIGLKVFERVLECGKNNAYQRPTLNTPISSVSALIGKNAVGKTSILECLYAQEHEYLVKDDRHYFMAFLNESDGYIEIRSRGIHISAPQIIEKCHRDHDSFYIYVVPVDGFTGKIDNSQRDATQFFFLSPMKVATTYVGYDVLDLPIVVGDLSAFNVRNSFCGAFDFLCRFPALVGRENKLVCYLKIDDRRYENEYFRKDNYTPEDLKLFFIYKLAKTVFSNLRNYLYHQKPEYMRDGSRLKNPNEEKLLKEDLRCAELLAPFYTHYPNPDSIDIIRCKLTDIPKEAIKQSFDFFEHSTFSFLGRSGYISFLESLCELFNQLYDLDSERFTAFYKIELPFDEKYNSLVTAMQNCLGEDSLGGNWTDGINVDFEWLSSGEYHVAMLFSAFYQHMKPLQAHGNCDVIWAIDEPEMHMHPELGRIFVDEMNKAMVQFRDAGLIKSCQFVFATHSPFIVQNLGKYNSNFTLVKKEGNQIRTNAFTDIPHLSLQSRTEFSFNLIMYLIFEIPTTELHDELYGELQANNQKYTETEFDGWLNSQGIASYMQWTPIKKGIQQSPRIVTLQTYIRNYIHHPENRLNARYTDVDLQKSIDQMIALL